jgi:hypothetical protein
VASKLVAGPCWCVACEWCDAGRIGNFYRVRARDEAMVGHSLTLPRPTDPRRRRRHDQRKERIIASRREPTSALDPPVQHEDERRHEIFGGEVRRNGRASIGPLECRPTSSRMCSAALGEDADERFVVLVCPSSPPRRGDIGRRIRTWKAEPQGSAETTDARWQCAALSSATSARSRWPITSLFRKCA